MKVLILSVQDLRWRFVPMHEIGSLGEECLGVSDRIRVNLLSSFIFEVVTRSAFWVANVIGEISRL